MRARRLFSGLSASKLEKELVGEPPDISSLDQLSGIVSEVVLILFGAKVSKDSACCYSLVAGW